MKNCKGIDFLVLIGTIKLLLFKRINHNIYDLFITTIYCKIFNGIKAENGNMQDKITAISKK